MGTIGEPILSRMDRLDNMMRHLEELRVCSSKYPKSSCASTPSSGTVTSMDTGHVPSSLDFSPKSLEKHCRPIDRVIMETVVKGSLIERLSQVEDRVLKLEKELEGGRREEKSGKKKAPEMKKGLRQMIKKFIKRNRKQKSKQ